MSKLEYEEFSRQTRQELVVALSSNDSEQIRSALYSAAKYESDWRWAQTQCLRFLLHTDHTIKWAAALALGYVAVYQRKIDLPEVLPALHAARQDSQIAPVVEDALEMILQHVKPS